MVTTLWQRGAHYAFGLQQDEEKYWGAYDWRYEDGNVRKSCSGATRKIPKFGGNDTVLLQGEDIVETHVMLDGSRVLFLLDDRIGAI